AVLTLEVGKYIESSNYDPIAGVGFRIDGDGSAFFGVDATFMGSVTIDTEGLGNSLEFAFDGDPVLEVSTTHGAVSFAAPSAQIEIGESGVIIGSGVSVAINTTLGELLLIGLPTSNPGGTNRVW